MATLYYIKSTKDLGQHGIIFRTPNCADMWIDQKFGPGGSTEGKKRGMYSIEVAEIYYYPCGTTPNHRM